VQLVKARKPVRWKDGPLSPQSPQPGPSTGTSNWQEFQNSSTNVHVSDASMESDNNCGFLPNDEDQFVTEKDTEYSTTETTIIIDSVSVIVIVLFRHALSPDLFAAVKMNVYSPQTYLLTNFVQYPVL
jgi:hypothetical protein